MKKILIVEDDISIRELLTEILEDEGYLIYSAENGSEGLKSLELSMPDLIIMDVMMPVMDGYAFRQELMKKSNWNSIPILVMSAQDQGTEKLASHGLTNFINKPLELNHFIEQVSLLA
jgi:CheY-like chemotaxis protein